MYSGSQGFRQNDDKIVIYLTREAEDRNWKDNGHKDRDGKPLQRVGLEHCIRDLGLRCKVEPVKDIPPGRTTDELWSIFESIVATIGTGDEVIADVTHGFRALPMLMTLVLNYTRLVKESRVTGLYYGAIEALGTPKQIEAIPPEHRDVHVLDLLLFGNLMDWTQAVESFLDSTPGGEPGVPGGEPSPALHEHAPGTRRMHSIGPRQ
nr:TM1812 family CRISPR-associated protein [Candidatus Sigynarchaeum springense]